MVAKKQFLSATLTPVKDLRGIVGRNQVAFLQKRKRKVNCVLIPCFLKSSNRAKSLEFKIVGKSCELSLKNRRWQLLLTLIQKVMCTLAL